MIFSRAEKLLQFKISTLLDSTKLNSAQFGSVRLGSCLRINLRNEFGNKNQSSLLVNDLHKAFPTLLLLLSQRQAFFSISMPLVLLVASSESDND